MRNYINKILKLSAVVLVAVSCTKERPLKFMDSELRDGLIKKELVNNTVYEVTTSDEKSAALYDETKPWLAVNNQDSFKVTDTNVPEKLEFMFKDLYIPTQPDQTFRVLLQADRVGVTASVLTQNLDSLPLIQQQLAVSYDQEPGFYKIPVFYYNIRNYGVPTAVKNELEEKTNAARLRSTDWEQATHVFLAPTATDRRPIGLVANAQRDWERVFQADQMIDKQVKASELRAYRITTGLEDSTNVVLKAQGSDLLVFEVTNLNSSLLSETDLELLRSGQQSDRLRRCDDVQGLKASDSCVLVGRYRIPVSRVEADRSVVDRGGEQGDVVVFRADQNLDKVSLLSIAENPTPIDFSPNDTWDPRFYYKVSDLLGKKFYFRRTIQDVPRQLPLFFVGEAGPSMLVEFSKRESSIVVKKVAQTIEYSDPSPTDIETVMSFEAEYFRAEQTDSAGRKLAVPRLVPTSAADSSSNVVVKLNWTTPNILPTGSPMGVDAFSAGLCFVPGQNFRVENLNNKLDQAGRGVLSFTLDGNYAANPAMAQHCFGSTPGIASWGSTWGSLDSNFNVKERISFYEHSAEDDKFSALNIPYEAQKAFGAGFISRPKVMPSESGMTGFQDNVSENLLLHDFKPNKKEIWYLVGLPSNYKYKNEVVEMTHKVFDDMNQKFKRAFKGTPKERTADVFEVRIVGVDTTENVVIGDQDKNIIVYEARPTENGMLGVYQGSGSPVNGKYIHGNVVAFGGNTLNNIEYMRWAAAIRKQYRDVYNKVVTDFAGQNDIDLSNTSTNGNSRPGLLSKLYGLLFGSASAPKQDVAPDTTSPSDWFEKLVPKFDNLVNQNTLPNIQANFGVIKSAFNPKSGTPKKLSDLIDVNSVSKNLQNVGGETLDVSRILDQALEQGSITKESYNFAIVQRVLDRAFAERGKNALNQDKAFVDFLIIDEFLKNPPMDMNSMQLADLQAEHSKVAYSDVKQKFYRSNGVPYCFNKAPELNDAIYDTMTTEDIFKSMFAHTLEHELLHNMGLEHQFEGSYDKKNWEFAGENVGRLSSALMEYGGMKERASWRGMGPHDVHAIRLAYTGMVELESKFAASVKKESPGQIKLEKDGAQFGIKVSNDNLISIHDLKKFIYPSKDWNEFSEAMIRYSPVPLKFFEYCTNRDQGLDPTCTIFDEGSTVPEVVTNLVNEHWQNYWISNYENNRYSYGIRNLIRNFNNSFFSFYRMRSYTDALLTRLLIQGRGQGYEDPKNIEDQLNLELFEASKISRDYILSYLKTPEAPAGLSSIDESQFLPIAVRVSSDDGTESKSLGIVESRSSYSIASGDMRYSRIGTYLDKLAAMEMLTMKLSSSVGMLNNDLAVPSSFSYLEFEKYLLGITDPLESPTIGVLKDYILEDVKPMILVGPNKNMPLELGADAGTIGIPRALSFTAAKAAILNTYSNALLEEYNFSNLFRVYSVRGRLPENMGSINSLVDLSYEQDTITQRRLFADGGMNSVISNAIINQNAIYRILMDQNSKLTSDLKAYVSMIIDTPATFYQGNEIKAIQDLNVRLAKKKQVLIQEMQSRLNFPEELATLFIDDLISLKELLPKVGQNVVGAFKNNNQAQLNQLMTQMQDLAFQNPFAFSGLAYYVQEAKSKQQQNVVGQFSVEIAEQIFSTEVYKMRYSSTKSNLEMMNIFYSYIEPSARNR